MSQTGAEIRDLVQESGLFDPHWYLEQYPDVQQLGLDPLDHFSRYGVWLFRDPGPGFSCQHYRTAYPDIAANKINPFLHYVKHGRNEGRAPTARASSARANTIEPDENGNLLRPNRKSGNGREFQSTSYNRDHYWYQNAETEAFLAKVGAQQLLPQELSRILVVGHDAKLSTGVFRSISHYLNAMVQAGGHEFNSVEPGKQADGWTLINDIDGHDFIIVNSLALFAYHDGVAQQLVERASGKSAVYLHETGWGFDGFEENYPERYAEFVKYAPELSFLCVSKAQEAELRDRFGIKHAQVVYETTSLPNRDVPEIKPDALTDRPLKIIMAGTIQPRKGVTLFSKVADLAREAGLPWTFHWAGWKASDDVYQSPNVNFLGNLEPAGLAAELDSSDVFFLSSEDDPFPLACLEAITCNKRVMVYRQTGIAEILEGVSGAGVFEEFTPEAAFKLLKSIVSEPLDLERYSALKELIGLESFVTRMNEAIETFWREGGAPVRDRIKPDAKVAVVLHLYYLDLWDEFQSYLRNLTGIDHDLYISMPEDADASLLAEVKRKILDFSPNAKVFVCENRGMDIGPFVRALEEVESSGVDYDLFLKVHSKKSLVASGAIAGAQWRRELLDGLMGSPTSINRIIDLFSNHPEIGMVGPRGMLIEKSTKDVEAGKSVNATHMDGVADRMELSDRQLSFFRGTMFWARAKPIIEACRKANLRIDEFQYGHQPDNSKAHAMERLFACIIRSAGMRLHQFERDFPKPISLLKGREAGKDIYVIAAGASCDFIDPAFFEGKCVIAVNRAYVRFPATYILYKEYAGLDNEVEMFNSKATPIIAKWHAGNIVEGRRRPNVDYFLDPRYYFFDHLENQRDRVNYSVVQPDSDKLVVSYSTITSAVHLAAYLGAKNIIIVGHDCGTIDGKSSFDGYYKSFFISPWEDQEEYRQWLSLIEGQTINVKKNIVEHFGCNVVSLNPFVNFGLEGHEYDRAIPTG